MRTILSLSLLLCVTTFAGAQERLSGTLSCPKPAVNEMGGDGSEVILFTRTHCTWSTPIVIAGTKATTATDVEIGDINGSRGRGHGFSTSLMENGDTTVTRYEGTVVMKPDGSASFKGTWRFVRGTGKFAGIRGGGTYGGTGTSDAGTVNVTGHYAIAKGKPKKSM